MGKTLETDPSEEEFLGKYTNKLCSSLFPSLRGRVAVRSLPKRNVGIKEAEEPQSGNAHDVYEALGVTNLRPHDFRPNDYLFANCSQQSLQGLQLRVDSEFDIQAVKKAVQFRCHRSENDVAGLLHPLFRLLAVCCVSPDLLGSPEILQVCTQDESGQIMGYKVGRLGFRGRDSGEEIRQVQAAGILIEDEAIQSCIDFLADHMDLFELRALDAEKRFAECVEAVRELAQV